jgi:hypothetical protein
MPLEIAWDVALGTSWNDGLAVRYRRHRHAFMQKIFSEASGSLKMSVLDLVNVDQLSSTFQVWTCSAMFGSILSVATYCNAGWSRWLQVGESGGNRCSILRHATCELHHGFSQVFQLVLSAAFGCHLPRLYSWVVAASRSLVKLGQAAAKVWTLSVPWCSL